MYLSIVFVLKCNSGDSSGDEITRYGDTLGPEARIYVVQMGLVSLHKGPVDSNLLKGDPKNRPPSFNVKNSVSGAPINNNNKPAPPGAKADPNSPPSPSGLTASTSSSGSTSPNGKLAAETPALPAQDRKSLERRTMSVLQ